MGGEKASLRDALRNRGGAPAAALVTPAQSEAEDEPEKSGLDWLNLTAFAPKNLQSVIEKLRTDHIPTVLRRGESDAEDGPQKATSGRPPPRPEHFSSESEEGGVDPSAAPPPHRGAGFGVLGAAGAKGKQKAKSGIRAALQARGGMQRAPAAPPAAAPMEIQVSGPAAEFSPGRPASPSAQSPLASSPLPSVEEDLEAEAADVDVVGTGVILEPPGGLQPDTEEPCDVPPSTLEKEEEDREEAAAVAASLEVPAAPTTEEESLVAPAESCQDEASPEASSGGAGPVAEEEAVVVDTVVDQEAMAQALAEEEGEEVAAASAGAVLEEEAPMEAQSEEPAALPEEVSAQTEEVSAKEPASSPAEDSEPPKEASTEASEPAPPAEEASEPSPVEAPTPAQEASASGPVEALAPAQEASETGPVETPEPAQEASETGPVETPQPAQEEPSPAEEPARTQEAAVAEAEVAADVRQPEPEARHPSPAPLAPAQPEPAPQAPAPQAPAPQEPASQESSPTRPAARAPQPPAPKIVEAREDARESAKKVPDRAQTFQHFNRPLPKLPGAEERPLPWKAATTKTVNRRHTLSNFSEEDASPKVEVKKDVKTLKEVKEFWGKNAKGFAGPAIGTKSRLSKCEAQATMQRLLATGGAVDFDEVRRLRKMIAELD